MQRDQPITLRSSLTLKNAFVFPLQNADARRDLVVGGLLLCIPVVGFMLNMGYRLHVVHELQRDQIPWPRWRGWRELFRHGFIATTAIVVYHVPALACLVIGWRIGATALLVLGVVLWVLATFTLPGFMTFYAVRFDQREIWNPVRALRRALAGGSMYMRAWTIGIVGVTVSFAGLLVFGVGFLFTSVWFWQVAAFCFARAFSEQHRLMVSAPSSQADLDRRDSVSEGP